MIILMCYVMICFSGIGPFAEILKSKTPIFFSVGITGLIVIANFGVMIKMTLTKMKDKWKYRKAKKVKETPGINKQIEKKSEK